MACVSNVENIITESIDGAIRIQEIINMFNRFGHVDNEATIPVNIHDILNSAINMAKIQVKHHITFEKKFEQYQPIIIGENNKLHQVFLNLIINAIQSFPNDKDKPGVITIMTVKENSSFRIDIQDTGMGIPPELISRIFEPFFSTKGVDEGTGLGLSISQDILKAYGGTITVQSILGKGTTFSVHLPIH